MSVWSVRINTKSEMKMQSVTAFDPFTARAPIGAHLCHSRKKILHKRTLFFRLSVLLAAGSIAWCLTGIRILYMSWSCNMEFCTCTGGLLWQHIIGGGVEGLV